MPPAFLLPAALLLASCGETPNTPPDAPQVSIGPVDPGTDDDLVVVLDQPSDDEDGDVVTYDYAWKQDGLPRADLVTDTVPASETTKGEVWEVIVTPNDGTADGDPATAETTVVNTPPVVTVVLEPTGPTTDDDLTASATATDADGDEVFLAYAWTVDGAPTGHDGYTVPAGDTTKHEVWAVTVVPSDGEVEGEPATTEVEVVNTPPTATLAFEPAIPGADEDVRVVATPADADGDVVSFTYAWSVDGKATGITSDTVPAADTAAGQVWTATVIPADDEEDGEPVSGTVPIENTPPVMVSVTLEPSEPFVTEDVVATAEATDIDGDPLTFAYTWTVDGVEALSGSSDTLPSGSFAKHQAIAVEVVPSDGFGDGAPLLSAEAVALNSPPTATGATLDPSEAFESTTLTCIPAGFSDADGDPEGWLYAWTVDGSTVGTASTLTGSGFDRGDSVTCTATPYDGEESGAGVSASLTVSNSTPVLASVALSTYAPTESDTISVTLGAATDADGDSITYAYDWYVDGGLASTASTLSPSRFEKGDSIFVVVAPYDGSNYGDEVTSPTATAANSPPAISNVTLSPTSVYTDDTLTATVAASDDDGDAITYTYTWYVDGAPCGGSGSVTLEGSACFDRDQEVWVVVTPNDGEDDGSAYTSGALTVSNTPPTAPEVAITPEDAVEGDDLTCTVTTESTDADGDALTYSFEWDVDGETYDGATGGALTSIVDGSSVGGEETWTCEVTASDGDLESAVGSASVETISAVLGSDEDHPGLSCEDILDAGDSSGDGAYWVDPDGSGAVEVFCDMTGGGWTLVANIYDSAGDDAPNATSYVVSGWQQTGSGSWTTTVSSVLQDSSGTGSAAVSISFVSALGSSAGQNNLQMCYVHMDGTDSECRSSDDGSLTLTSYSSGNAKLTVYYGDDLAYTYGRLAGLAGSYDGYVSSLYTEAGYPISKTPGVTNDYLFGGEGLIIDKNAPYCPAYDGVWHCNGAGQSYKPWETDAAELSSGGSDAAGCYAVTDNPTVEGYGFRLYVGP